MTEDLSSAHFVSLFRSVAPYVNLFRGKTFVIAFGGRAISGPFARALAYDANLLAALGVHLVLVHGARPQIEEELREKGLESRSHAGYRITDEAALDCVIDAVGSVYLEIGALLSQGLPDTPMANSTIHMVTGNFITTKPLGVIDGVDMMYAGSVRKIDAEGISAYVQAAVLKLFDDKEAAVGSETMRMLEKHLMLTVLDQSWKEHLGRMDYLRQGIHLRGYAQKQPKQEYKKEAFELFSEMLEKVKREVISLLARVRIRSEEEIVQAEAAERARAEAVARQMQFQHPDMGGYSADEEAADPDYQNPSEVPKVGRNDPCPCGSGKKYKHCHGQLA